MAAYAEQLEQGADGRTSVPPEYSPQAQKQEGRDEPRIVNQVFRFLNAEATFLEHAGQAG